MKTFFLTRSHRWAVQFTPRAFAIGWSHEWGHTLFIFLGCFAIVWVHA